MKDEVLKRGMFSQPMSKSARNSGIMEGFEDEMEDEGTPPLARSPQNPEILMNNLRGDMRSVDARYLELAQMVGEEAAMETPPEVLAMLQPQLAAQTAPAMPQGGIGALPQGAQMAPPPMMGQGPAMPPGMEGMPPFPQGGAEQAPPTPDGMPPLRAAGGTLVSDGARLASQGFGKISSALTPYMTRGIEYLDQFVTPFLRPGMRVEQMTEDGRRAVIQGRENIVQGPQGPEFGKGTRLEAANTLNMGRVPFSQAIRQDPLLGMAGNAIRKNPKLKALGAGVLAADIALYNNLTSPNAAPRSAEELAQVNALIDQIPPQGPPIRDAKGNYIDPRYSVGARPNPQGAPESSQELTVVGGRPNPVPKEGPPSTTEGTTETTTAAVDPNEQLVQPPSLLQRLVGDKNQFTYDPNLLGRTQEGIIPKKGDTTQFVKDNVFKTRGERIRAEYKDLEPTFRELLGDTKADARTNALLLLADAGFKFASTYKPTMAMALSESLSGVPKGFAAIVAQAKDRDIKIKTAVLQEAVNSVNVQDKIARDFQLESLRIEGRLANSVLQARSREQLENIRSTNAQILENIKGGNTRANTILTNDLAIQLELVKNQGLVEEDGGVGLTIVKDRKGSLVGSYIKPDANGKLPPEVEQAITSRWTLRETDNPFVDNVGNAPTTFERDKGERIKLNNTLRSLDNSLKSIDNIRGTYVAAYSPGTWVQDKINNIIVPVSGGSVRPDVKQDAVVAQIRMTMNGLMKQIAAANDSGRVAVQEQEWVREMTDALNNPTAFFANKDRAAKLFAVIETQLRNSRQQVLTQLGFENRDFTMRVPQTGTETDPFVVPADPEGQKRMFTYLGSVYGSLQDPNAKVYVQKPNGKIDPFTPPQLRKFIGQ